MERDRIVAQAASASSPNDISSAINAARDWLATHPQDDEVRRGLQRLMRAEWDRLHLSR
jgi:hypothetical protein